MFYLSHKMSIECLRIANVPEPNLTMTSEHEHKHKVSTKDMFETLDYKIS